MGGVGVGITLCFVLLVPLNHSFLTSFVAALIPIAPCLAYIFGLRQTLETKAKFIAQVMSGDMTIRRPEDLDSAALTYAEVKAIASGNPLVIEKAQMDAELMRLTRLRSAYAEEQCRIRSNLRRSHEDAECSHSD